MNKDNIAGKLAKNREKFNKMSQKVQSQWSSMNRWETKDQLLDLLLNQKKNILITHYSFGSIANSSSTNDSNFFNWCVKLDEGLIMPDLVFYFDTSIEVLKKRRRALCE